VPPGEAHPVAARDAGFRIVELDQYYEKGAPKVAGAHSLGVAASP